MGPIEKRTRTAAVVRRLFIGVSMDNEHGILSLEQVMAIKEREKKREDARLRKQRSRQKQREEAARKKQAWMEKNDPLARWQRNRTERPDEYNEILQRQKENLDDHAWLKTYTALVKSGRMKDAIDADLLLDRAACAWLNIEEHGFDDHFYPCVKAMDGHFQPAGFMSVITIDLEFFHAVYEVAMQRKAEGNLKIANIEWFEFGVPGVRVPKDLWEAFLQEAVPFIKRTLPNWKEDQFAAMLVGPEPAPPPIAYGGATCQPVNLPKPRVRE